MREGGDRPVRHAPCTCCWWSACIGLVKPEHCAATHWTAIHSLKNEDWKNLNSRSTLSGSAGGGDSFVSALFSMPFVIRKLDVLGRRASQIQLVQINRHGALRLHPSCSTAVPACPPGAPHLLCARLEAQQTMRRDPVSFGPSQQPDKGRMAPGRCHVAVSQATMLSRRTDFRDEPCMHRR